MVERSLTDSTSACDLHQSTGGYPACASGWGGWKGPSVRPGRLLPPVY